MGFAAFALCSEDPSRGISGRPPVRGSGRASFRSGRPLADLPGPRARGRREPRAHAPPGNQRWGTNFSAYSSIIDYMRVGSVFPVYKIVLGIRKVYCRPASYTGTTCGPWAPLELEPRASDLGVARPSAAALAGPARRERAPWTRAGGAPAGARGGAADSPPPHRPRCLLRAL